MNHYDKQAREFLRSDKMREALARQLGCEIEKPTEEDVVDRPIVAALVPCYDHPEPKMTDAFMQMQRASRDVCSLVPGPPVSSSVVHWSRNWLIAELIKKQQPWTHVLFIDDDIVAPPDALIKMLAHKKDIVAGLCTRRTDPPIPNIRYQDEETFEFREIWEWPSGLIEVGAVGTGLMLISREALQKVAEVYLNCLYEKDVLGMSDERAEVISKNRAKYFEESANGQWFRFLPIMQGTYEMGEDVSFCFVARKYCDLKIYCDTTIQPGHVGPYVYGIPDFEPYRDMCVERAKAQGQYRTQPKIDAEIQLVG